MNIVQRYDKLLEIMPQLKSYSFRLLFFLVNKEKEEYRGISFPQWFIMDKTGLCQRSLQMAISELEEKGLITRHEPRNSTFVIHL